MTKGMLLNTYYCTTDECDNIFIGEEPPDYCELCGQSNTFKLLEGIKASNLKDDFTLELSTSMPPKK